MLIEGTIKKNWPVITALIERNMVGRYRSSAFGFAWNFITPILIIIVVYTTFVSIKSIHLDKTYWAYLSIGIFMMTCCGACLRGRAFLNNTSYVRKMAVPRWTIVVADVIAQFIVLTISYAMLIIIILSRGMNIDVSALLFIPLELFLLFLTCIGFSLLFSTLSVMMRDVGHVMSVMSRVVLWLTPVFYYLEDANELLYTISIYNPFTYFLEPFHQMMDYGVAPDLDLIGMSVLITIIVLALGWAVYRHFDDRLAESI